MTAQCECQGCGNAPIGGKVPSQLRATGNKLAVYNLLGVVYPVVTKTDVQGVKVKQGNIGFGPGDRRNPVVI